MNRKLILCVVLALAIVGTFLVPTGGVLAGTGYSPITVWLGASSVTVSAEDYATLLASYSVTITGTYSTNSFEYTGVPIYRVMEFAFPQIGSMTGYSVLTADSTDYKVIYGPNVMDNTPVKGNDNLIIATSGTVNGVAGTNFPRSACSTFTAGNRFNNNVATMRLQYAIQAPTPIGGQIVPASGWYSGSRNPWQNSTTPALGVDFNADQQFNMTANSGNLVAALTVDGGAVTPATSYTFRNVTASHTLAATFAPVSVYIDPPSQGADNGAPFTVNLAINTNPQSRGWQANIDFDADKMQYTGITEGGFLKDYALANSGGTQPVPGPSIDNVNGHVTNIGYFITGAGTAGPSGTGTLCTLSFTAKTGVDSWASITPSGVVVSDNTGVTIAGTSVSGGAVAIGNIPMPDLVVSAASAAKAGDNTYTVTYTVTNQGNLAAGACSTSIVVDGGAPIVIACPALAAAASDTQTTAAQTFTGPTDTIVVTADSANAVAEKSEANNSRQIVYALAGDTGDVIVNGNILAKLDLTVPSDILNWVLEQGANSTSGTANVKCNTPWQLQVNDQNANTSGHMTKWNGAYDISGKLANPLHVGSEIDVALSGSNQVIADGIVADQSGDAGQDLTVTYSQQVLYSDPVLTGGYTYHIVVTFTASSTI